MLHILCWHNSFNYYAQNYAARSISPLLKLKAVCRKSKRNSASSDIEYVITIHESLTNQMVLRELR